MPNYKVLMVFSMTLLLSNCIYSQEQAAQDTTKKKDSAAIADVSSKLDKVLEYLEKSKDTDQEETGVFSYDTLKRVPLYTPKGKRSGRTIIIDKVTLLIQDGYIIDIQVFSGKNVFTNTQALISINGRRFSLPIRDFLYNKKNSQESIILQEAISYTPIKTFFPEDGVITLNKSHFADTVKRNVGVNTVLDLRLYTDALAALGNEPNGIFQTDVRLKQFLHRLHYRNTGGRVFGYFKVNFTASKIDSKFSYVDSSDNIPRTDLYQKSKIVGELILNLWTNWLEKKTLNSYYLDLGGSFNNVNLAKSKDTVTITVPSVFLEFGINLKNSSNIGFDFHARYSCQYSPETDFKDQDKRKKFLRLGAEVFWNPFKDPANRVFGRINYLMGLTSTEKKNNFSQVQIGYSVLLSKALGNKKG